LKPNAPALSALPRRVFPKLLAACRVAWLSAIWGSIGFVLVFSEGCQHQDSLQRVLRRGELIVATRNGPTSYYIGPTGNARGFEYDLASRFARHLGVKLKLHVEGELDQLLPDVLAGKADLAAAGLTITDKRKQRVAFGPVYQKIHEQVVYHSGHHRPRSVDDLAKGTLAVLAGSSYEDHLEELKPDHPGLTWKTVNGASIEPLFQKVAEGDVDYTIADSTMVALHRRYFPQVQPAFSIGDSRPLAWAFSPHDDALRREAEKFFAKLSDQGVLTALQQQYYEHVRDFDFVGVHTFLRHVDQRLPTLRPVFEEASAHTGLDWRLLAAVGYQESHWDSDATSPTGVRGVMMLTQQTAGQLGIDNRLNPKASVMGGAQYLKRLKERLPEHIKEPDRTWMALAAYNIGMGHLEDARVITEIRDGDPDRWLDVKENLPLLSDKRWYSRVKYGYARGQEPAQYVENIRSYYDILVWLVDRGAPILQAAANTGPGPAG